MVGTSEISTDCCKGVFNTPAQHKKLFIAILLLLLFYTSTGNNVKNKNFDYFVFSQRWLPSACVEYAEYGPRHECDMPKNFDFWAIHGLWPTQDNHLGPFFCNKSLPFDVNKLNPIRPLLKLYWPNIEGGKGVASLWQHEWEKHGTCAAQLESLDTEFKYFNKTLDLYKSYNIQQLFQYYNIKPSLTNGVSVADLFKIVKKAFGSLPQITCIHEVKTNKPYLAEIRLCFNKNIDLQDCGNIVGDKLIKHLTNCPLDSKVIFPDNINPEVRAQILLDSSVNRNYYNKLVDMLHILRFLMWASI